MIRRQQPAESWRDMGRGHQWSYLLLVVGGVEVRGDTQCRGAGMEQGRGDIEARGGGIRDAQVFVQAGMAQGNRRHLGQDREEAMPLYPPVQRGPCDVVLRERHSCQGSEEVRRHRDGQAGEEIRFVHGWGLRGESCGELRQAARQSRPPQGGGIG